jgi:hypothetical protein
VRARARARVCVCARACVRACVCVCVCVCVGVCVCVCVLQLSQDSVHCATFVIRRGELSGSTDDTKFPKQITDHQLLPGCGP